MFLIIVILILVVIVTILVTVDIIGIINRNSWVMVRSITFIKLTTRRIIVVSVIVRNITGVMVMVIWIVIRYTITA